MNTSEAQPKSTDFVSVGGLWRKKSGKSGKEYLSGYVEMKDLVICDKLDKRTGEVKQVAYITIFDVEKNTPESPSYRVYQSHEKKSFIKADPSTDSAQDDDKVDF